MSSALVPFSVVHIITYKTRLLKAGSEEYHNLGCLCDPRRVTLSIDKFVVTSSGFWFTLKEKCFENDDFYCVAFADEWDLESVARSRRTYHYDSQYTDFVLDMLFGQTSITKWEGTLDFIARYDSHAECSECLLSSKALLPDITQMEFATNLARDIDTLWDTLQVRIEHLWKARLQKPFRFLDLPREIRDRIYRHLLIPVFNFSRPHYDYRLRKILSEQGYFEIRDVAPYRINLPRLPSNPTFGILRNRAFKAAHRTLYDLTYQGQTYTTTYSAKAKVTLYDDHTVIPKSVGKVISPDILLANKQTYSEASQILYSANSFCFTGSPQSVVAFLRDRGKQLQHIRSLGISYFPQEVDWSSRPAQQVLGLKKFPTTQRDDWRRLVNVLVHRCPGLLSVHVKVSQEFWKLADSEGSSSAREIYWKHDLFEATSRPRESEGDRNFLEELGRLTGPGRWLDPEQKCGVWVDFEDDTEHNEHWMSMDSEWQHRMAFEDDLNEELIFKVGDCVEVAKDDPCACGKPVLEKCCFWKSINIR